MAIRDITDLINSYRECSRNLWNVYFAKLQDVGSALDAFEQIREVLFESLVLSNLSYSTDKKCEQEKLPALRVIPRTSSPILIQRMTGPGGAGYWDEEKDMVVGPDNIALQFIDYFDFLQVPIKEFHYYRCKIIRFPSHENYEGREALLEVSDARVCHDPAWACS